MRLRHLLLAGNPVSSITPALAAQLPTLISLTLTGCKVRQLRSPSDAAIRARALPRSEVSDDPADRLQLADLPDLDPLAGCKHLEFLSLKDSPVTSLPHYRHWVIHRCRKVRVLDFEHVTEKERKRAAELFVVAGTANEPTPLAASISSVDPAAPPAVPVAKTFTPGEANGASGKGRKLTDEERARVRRAIESAKTVEEMRCVDARRTIELTRAGCCDASSTRATCRTCRRARACRGRWMWMRDG